ncbi:glycerophosphodiester phosphodiesterase family protein [Psychromarinibacter sp. C21-152]|uniref:Glycerophosphodiester phosphodiesterase family protein n=1 Tax=Psychromarinibacter sediminicola TaxID=3033385 RepID=A0AAE3TC13_9RHOB|nr:glycerophosphodiester phosphodiesterase family protein [Psychromarinibacter sediminicola]MDF0603474.1 glycerophosphodiester phosphodiesterase family protein [Psychromarinibacter sediminicola]
MTLPEPFLTVPLAHRGYHDAARGVPENSRAAFEAAIAAGYGIELDVQLSGDGQAMVFHDYDLARLTWEKGKLCDRTARQLSHIKLKANAESIPTLDEVLELVAGRVPLLIEIKDQDGAMERNVGPLERATARALGGYEGPLAVMSFNPHAVEIFGDARPEVPRGLTTCAYLPHDWPMLPGPIVTNLRDIPDYDRVGASFISHRVSDLARPRVAELKARGASVLCWTVRSPEEEAAARKIADNVTFEGYAAELPGG